MTTSNSGLSEKQGESFQQSGPPSPERAVSQCAVFLRLLRLRAEAGVSSSELIFEHRILRPGSRAYDLRNMGVELETRKGPGGTAVYVLRSEPIGGPRPLPRYSRKPRPVQASLFAEARA
jgi:hypothetical protein